MRQNVTLLFQSHVNAAGTIGTENRQIIIFVIGGLFICHMQNDEIAVAIRYKSIPRTNNILKIN